MTQAGTKRAAPRGWDRIVAQLQASPDLTTFHTGILDLQCKIVAAEYGALWLNDGSEDLRVLSVWPARLAEMPSDNPVMNILRQSAQSGFERGTSHVLKAEPEDQPSASDSGAHVFVTAMRVKGDVVAISTVVAECRDTQVLQSTAPLRELAAGLYEGYIARIEARRQEADAARIREAIALLGVSQEAGGFNGACLNLVNELARQTACARVSLGWVRGKLVKVIAMSDTEHIKRHSEQAAQIEMAMAECHDQEQPVVYPVPDDAEPLLQQTVVHNHRRLHAGHAGRHILSIPLRHGDESVGVLTLERGETGFTPDDVQYMQLVSDVIAPHLDDRKHGDRNLVVHAWQSLETAVSYLVGPKHTIWKAVAVIACVTMLYMAFGSWHYRVTAPFILEAEQRRIVPAPFEGQLAEVLARPGDRVTAGQPLARFDTEPLILQRNEAHHRYVAASLERDKAEQEQKIGEMRQAEAAMDQLEARVELLDYLLRHATIRSPLDGVLLDGDWQDRIGGVVEQGDAMFEIAPLENLVAVLRVDESDIGQIDTGEHGRALNLTGTLATRSEPSIGFRVTTDRLVPLAKPVDGANVFEVRALLGAEPWSATDTYEADQTVLHDGLRYRARKAIRPSAGRPALPPDQDLASWEPANWLRPGMEGLAKIDVGDRRIYWILSHRIADTLRLWFWL